MLGPSGSGKDKFRILIIESDAELARVLLASLSAAGFECRLAPDGANGVKAFHDTHPHLVLFDLAVIGGQAMDVCINIRESSMTPIIVIADDNSEAEQLEVYRLGCDDYIYKPVNTKLLVARVVAYLRRVYRYDMELYEEIKEREKARIAAQRKAALTPAAPAGWASCGHCNYMGPRERFERFNPEGAMVMICPNCNHRENITYSLG